MGISPGDMASIRVTVQRTKRTTTPDPRPVEITPVASYPPPPGTPGSASSTPALSIPQSLTRSQSKDPEPEHLRPTRIDNESHKKHGISVVSHIIRSSPQLPPAETIRRKLKEPGKAPSLKRPDIVEYEDDNDQMLTFIFHYRSSGKLWLDIHSLSKFVLILYRYRVLQVLRKVCTIPSNSRIPHLGVPQH